MIRKVFWCLLLCLMTLPLTAGEFHNRLRCEPFPLNQVRLLPSRFSANFRRDSALMMSIPVNELLHSFRNTSGVFSSREGGYMTQKKMGGWESLDCDLRGHITGHLMSALAALYAQTGSVSVKQKCDSIVNGLDEVQQMYGSGYLSAFGEGLINRCIAGKPVWAPWYTLHKILQGLIDQYSLCGNDTALAMACRMGDWAYRKVSRLDEATRYRMLRNEFGGFNETMYELYALTSSSALSKQFFNGYSPQSANYLKVARFFYDRDKIDPLKNGNLDLGTNHANTFIPKLLGEARNYELFGNQDSRKAAELLFRTLAFDHAFVTGEVSDREHLFNPKEQYKHLSGYDGETCCTFNLLKLAAHVFCWHPEEKTAEYVERALYNQILGQQDPESSMMCYFTPLQTGTYRLYSTRDSSFWCCMGSGFESHVKYAACIYYHSDDSLWVNLNIPSEVNWEGTLIRQETLFPESGTSTFLVKGKSRRFALQLRYPVWAVSMSVFVNGKRQHFKKIPGEYVSVSRLWTTGDSVVVKYGMNLHEESVKGDRHQVALLFGPIVLAGNLGTVDHPFSDPKKYNDYYTYNFHVPEGLAERATWNRLSDIRHLSGLHFKSKSGVDIAPFYEQHHCRYVVYWNQKE